MPKETTLILGDLEAGDCVEIRTAHSLYRFWMEFPSFAVGVVTGGQLPTPTRVRLSADPATATEAPMLPLQAGDRARMVLLAPDGLAIRCIVTSRIAGIRVTRRRTWAA